MSLAGRVVMAGRSSQHRGLTASRLRLWEREHRHPGFDRRRLGCRLDIASKVTLAADQVGGTSAVGLDPAAALVPARPYGAGHAPSVAKLDVPQPIPRHRGHVRRRGDVEALRARQYSVSAPASMTTLYSSDSSSMAAL